MSLVKIFAVMKAQLGLVPNIIPEVAVSVAAGSPAVFTSVAPHLLKSGLSVILTGYTGGTPALTDTYLAIVTGANTFTLQNSATKAPVAVTIPGSGGSVRAVLTADHNAVYPVVAGVPYQLVHIIPFKPDEPTQGGGYRREHGVFQVTLVYPAGVGDGAVLARGELVRSFFKKGTTLVYDGATVLIDETPEFGYLQGASDNISFPVKIGYSSNVYS